MLLLLLFLAIALGFSFLCSIAEAVLLSVSPGYIELQAETAKKNAKRWRKIKSDVESSLAAILSLNTIAHTVGAAGVGAQAAVVFGDSSLAIVSAVLTFLILVFSEIIPKTLGTYYWRALARPVGAFLVILVLVARWFGLIALSRIVSKIFTGKKSDGDFDRSEYAALAAVGEAQGALGKTETRILGNLMSLKETRVKDVMTPRPVMFTLDEKVTVGEFMSDYIEQPFSRVPVFKDEPDNIVGFVLRTDVFEAKFNERDGKRLQKMVRDIGAISHMQDVYTCLRTMSDRKEHIMLAVDEYGSVRGLVTMEDVLETLIGLEIVDERDHVEDMQKAAHDLWKKRAIRKGIQLNDD